MNKQETIRELTALREKAESMPTVRGKRGLVRKIDGCIERMGRYEGVCIGADLFVRECVKTYEAVFGAEK